MKSTKFEYLGAVRTVQSYIAKTLRQITADSNNEEHVQTAEHSTTELLNVLNGRATWQLRRCKLFNEVALRNCLFFSIGFRNKQEGDT
jgi:hypothetical protein